MSTQQDAIKRLYPVASKFYKIDTEEEFREKMQDQQKRKKLYDGLLGRGLTTEQLGDYDKFDAYITQSFNNPANVPIQEPQRPGITDAQPISTDAQQTPPTATGEKAQDILRTGIAQGLKQHDEKQDALLQTKEEGLQLQQMYDLFEKENEDAIFLAKTKRSTASVPGMVMPGSAYTEQEADVVKQRNTLQSALELNKKTQEILAAPSRFDDSNAFANFGKGAASRASDIDFWTFGITNIARNLNTRDVAMKLQKAQDEYGEDVDIDTILTEPEKALLGAFFNNLHASALRADDLSLGYQAGQGAMDSAKFMAEFILTGGISKAATKGATKALESWIVKNIASKAGRTLAKGGLAVAKGLVGTAARTPVMLSTYSNITDQAVQYDENGRLRNSFEAVGLGFLDSFIENLSETMGEHIIAGMKLPFTGLISKIPETGFTKFFQNLSKTGAYKLMKQGGWNGFAGEYFEEWYGNSLRALTGNKEALQDFATVEQQLITLASFAPITILGGAVSTAQYASAEKNFQNATLALKDILKDNGYKTSQAEYIMDLIMDTTPSQMAKKVAPIINQMALETEGDAGNLLTGISEFIRTKSIMQGYDGIYQAEHQEKRQELDQDIQNEIGEYTNKKGEVEMAVDKDGNANYVLSDVANELEPLIVIKGLDGQTKMVSKSEYEANYTPSVLTSKDEYLSQMIMTKQEAELAEEIKIEEDANFLNSIELGVPQYFNINGVMTEGTPQAITPDGSITVHFGNHVEMLTADQYKALNQPTTVTATQTEDLAQAEQEQAEQEQAEIEEQEELAQEQAQPVQEEKQSLPPEEVSQEQTPEAQEAPKEIPKTADGETDFDALLDSDPETYAQELSRAIGEERAANTMSALARQTDAQIEKLQKRLEKETSTNKIVSINRNIDQLQQRRDVLTGLIIKGSKPKTPQATDVTGAQTTKTAQPVRAGEIGQNIVEKWDNAPKDYGIEETFTLPNGKEIKGRWVLSEAGAVTPSHDPHTLQQSEGFPVTKDGKTANSNDYTKKLDMVELVSADYDRRAIDNPVYVKRGAVLSGNNRTISGILAAERGTDKKYIQALTDKAGKLGFTPEQISKYKHPRVVIEVTDDLPITTETFAMFNRDDKKQQSPTELAVVASKMDNTRTIGLISRELDGYERLSDLYQNPGASATIAKYLVEGGLITQFELSPLFANNSFTSGGKDFLESVLVGSVLREDQINILDTEGMKATRQRVVKAIVPLIENSKIREEGRIIDDINTGVMYLYQAKKAGMTLREYFLQSNMFEAATYDLNGVRNALVLQGAEKDFRDYVQLVNKRLKDPIANMFTGEIETKDDLYKELENQYNDEQRRTIEAARAANVQAGAATNDQGTVLPGVPKDNEPGGSGISADAGEQTEASPATNEGSGTEIGQQSEQPKTDLGITSIFDATEKVAKNSQGEIAPQSEAGIPASEESHTQEEKKEEPGIVSVFKTAQEQKEKDGAREGASLEDLSTEDIEARVAEYDKIINEREAYIERSNTPLTGSNSGVGTLTEDEFNEYTNLTAELQRRNTISAKEAKEMVAKKRAERLEAMKQSEKKEEPGIVSVFKAAQEHKEKNEVQNKQDGKTIIPQKISKPKMPKTKEEYCSTLASIVSNDPMRPVMTGVLFDADNKMIVASDALRLIAIPSSLPKTTEIIAASKRKSSGVEFGQLLKGQYPNYKAVIPLSSNERFEGRFNIELLLGQALTMLKEANERIKQLDKPTDQEKAHERILKFGIHYVDAKVLSDVLRALYDTGTKHIVVEYSRKDRPLVFRDERNMNKVGLVMPVYMPEEGEDDFEERFRNIPVLVNRNTIAINKEPGNKEEKKESEKEDSAMKPDNSPVAEEEEKADKQAQTEKIDNIFASLSDLAPHNEQLWAKTSISRWQADKFLKDIREFQDAAIENGAIEYKEHLDRHNYEMIEGKEIKINTYKLNGYTIEVGYDGGFGTHGASGFYTQVENPQGEVLKIYDPKYRTEKTYDISYQHPRFREKLEKSAEVIDPSIKPKKGDKIAFEIGGREVKFEYDSFISDKNGTLTYDYFGIKMLKPGEYRIERGGNVINVKQGNGSNTKLASTEEREVLEKIEDFGEKIEGAKKDIWQKNDATSEDIKSLPLSKIFPRPDFPQLVKDGKLLVESALLLRYLYDTIPPKPRKEYKLKTWVSVVKGVIDAMNTLIDNPSYHEQIMSKMGLLLPSYHNSITTYIALHKELGFPETDLNTGKYEVKRFDGRGYSIINGPYIISDHETLAEAAAALKRRIEQNREKLSSGEVKLSIYQDTRTKKYFIGRKGATGIVRLVDNIEKLADAKTMFRDQQVQLQEMWRQLKVTPEERRSSNRERIGVDYRKGKNITPETFSETFGFRGVQFGNWVNNDERQGSLNEAFDALMDLSTTLGISGRALSLNGELGIAFGARGSGKYNAHYEPGQVVINLTKTKGAGSLAHEWWHALDNYFSRMKGDESKYFTESPRQKILNTGEKDQSVRKEMADSFKALVSAINKSGLPERSKNLDRARSAPYWSTIIEMSARSFENYIIEKLAANEGSNDYLANFKEIGEWAERGLNENNYPYPTKDETEVINPAFQDLFDTIQEKVDQDTGNVMLFRTAEEQSFSIYTELDQIKQKAITDGSFMKAPNGKQTNLNERQWLQVRTKAFKEWFGDWENDPKNASKVVDENGEPLVVYHGTNAEFNEFRANHGQIMFSPFRKYAQIMAGDGKVMEAYLKIERPFEEMDLDFFEWPRDYEEYVEELKARGYDGAISADNGEQISVFNPNQIKSATDNVGTFDNEDSDIRYRMAEFLEEESLYKYRNNTTFTDSNGNNKGRNSILQEDAVQMQLSWAEQVGDVPAQRAAAIAADPGIAKIQQSAGYNPIIDNGFAAVERVLSNNGAVTFMGNPLTGPAKIKGPGDVAFLFKNLESASSENAFIALIDKKNNYRVLYLSTGNEYSTIIDFKSIPAAIKEFDAAKICMVHNHPSGSLTPSDNDIKCQKRINQIAWEMGIEAMPGIIINLDTGKYAEFTQDFTNHPDRPRNEDMGDVSPVDIYAFDRQVLYMPSSRRIQLSAPDKVAQFISQQKRGINGKVHVLILDRALMVGRYFLMDGNLSTSEMLNTIWPAVGKHGIYVMLASNDQFNNVQLSELKNGLKLIDSQLLDVLTIKQDKGIITNYESLANQGLLDEQVLYEKQQTMLNDMVAAKKFMNDKGPSTYTELTEDEIPENTQVAYKLMRYFNNKPGVLYPLYAKDEAGKKGFKKGVWYKAERQSVKIGSKNLAERPGIHAVDLPLFLQGKVRKSGETRVWAKVLMPAMSEKTQAESDNTTLLPNGQRSGIRERVIGPKEAYNFKTNPNATGSGVWPIAGSMKVERVLSDTEVEKILVDNGKEDYVTLSMSGDPEIRFRTVNDAELDWMDIDGIERSTTNSEGKRIAPTEQGVRNFWKWFGDSKVVDEEGRPLVVYHGTNKVFNSFNEGTQYFAVNENEASGYAKERSNGLDKGTPNIISAYLKIVNPAKDDDIIAAAEQAGVDPDSDITSALANIKEVKTILERSGFDGIGPVLDLGFESDFDEFETYATFNANQIKSATGNTGAFDPNNNDIRFRTVDESGFYSTVESALEGIKQNKGTPQQFKAMLLKNGAKQAELDWMGWDDQFPDARKKASKEKQLDIIQSTNPMRDDNHVGIRTLEDIKTFDQVVDDPESFVYGDFSKEDAQKALKEGFITVYSSTPIKNGAFVSTSEKQAKDYAGNGKVYSQKVNLGDVAWINGDEGQLAKADNTITKAEIQDWIDQNRIEVQEVINREERGTPIIKKLNDRGIGVAQAPGKDIFYWISNGFPLSAEEKFKNNDLISELASIRMPAPKYSQYTVPGGKNYRELLLTMPSNIKSYSLVDVKTNKTLQTSNDYEELVDRRNELGGELVVLESNESKGVTFKSGHFDEPNILAHVRFNERTVNGERVLFIEEIQSDWAQEGKKKGFRNDEAAQKTIDDLKAKVESTEKEMIEASKKMQEAYPYATRRDLKTGSVLTADIAKRESLLREVRNKREYDQITSEIESLKQDQIDTYNKWYEKAIENSRLIEQLEKAEKDAVDNNLNGIPNMPFKKTDQWVNLAFRRMMRYAAENGFDRIAWTTGEQQADRYDLSKHVDRINWTKRDDKFDISPTKDGKHIGFPVGTKTTNLTKTEVANLVGKEIADKIEAETGKNYETGQLKQGVLSGLDLKVGGEGMIAFYDNIVPKAANKLGKPFRADVEMIDIPEIGQQQSIPVTDALREIAPNGMPLFRVRDTEAREAYAMREWNRAKKAIDESGFYSTVEDALEHLPQEKGTPDQMKAMLLKNGAKEAEMDWMGYDQQFKGKSVTKQEIQDWIDQNRIEVQEVEKGRTEWEQVKQGRWERAIDRETPTGRKARTGRVVIQEIEGKFHGTPSTTKFTHVFKTLEEAKAYYDRVDGFSGNAKYSQYTVPGGKNYRELLLTLPGSRTMSFEEFTEDHWGDISDLTDRQKELAREQYDRYWKNTNKAKIGFKSGHFDEPNILAHIRFNEREVNGERVLFIEEIQSDWAQEGKKEGFKSDNRKAITESLRKEKDNFYTKLNESEDKQVEYGLSQFESGKISREQLDKILLANGYSEYDLKSAVEKNSVPDMPFKKTDQWVSLALRRMMRYAAENVFDRIAWTNGEQQADRYDLSKHIDNIVVEKGSPKKSWVYKLRVGFKGAQTQQTEYANSEAELEDIVGKELTKKIIADNIQVHEEKTYSGLDLKVGGEGMKAFYDNIVPKAANKLGKPFGAKIEEIQLPLVAEEAYNEQTEELELSTQAEEIQDRFMESQAEEGDYELEDYVQDMKDAGYEVLFENGEPVNLKKITTGQTFTVQSLPVTYAMKETVSAGVPLFRPSNASSIRERIIARDRLESMVDKLNIKVNIVNQKDVKDQKQRNSKGFYNTRTGEITIVLDNHKTADDAIATLLHEAVAHKGLRTLFGADFNRFLDSVYQNAGKEERAEIGKLITKYGWDTRLATEEYLATLAESTNYNESESLWRKIKNFFMDMLRRAGIKMDGVLTDADLRYILQRSYDRLTDPSGPGGVFDAARDAQIRRRVGLNSDNDTRYRSNKNAAQDKVEQFANNAYDARLNETMNKIREAHQDSMLSLKILQEEVAKASGKEIQTFENAYLAENHISSKNLYEKEHFMANYYEPMSKAIRSLADKLDGEYQSVVTYAMAKHGLERNIKLAERDAKKMHAKWKAELDKKLAQELIDQAKYDKEIKRLEAKYDETVAYFRGRDYSGLTALFPVSESVEELPDVALAEAMAQELMDQVEEAAPEEVQELWSRVNAATKKSLYKTYETGILTRSIYENIRDMYDYYIPLRGFSETTADDVYEYLQFDRSSFSPPVLTARGRKSMADDPFATIGTMAESAIQQGNNNWMKQKFLNMALNHESDLISVQEMWYENKGTEENPDWIQAMPDIEPGASAMEVNQAYEVFEQRMTELVEIGMAKKSMKGLNIPYRTLGKQAQEHSVIVKSAGKEYVIFINGNPRAAQAINGLTNPDVSDARKKIMRANRWLAANYTTRSPKFMLRNLSRDTIYSLFNIYVKEDKAYNRRFRANLARSYVSIWKLMRDYSQNKLDVTTQEGAYMQEFLANGGETGYTVLKRVDEYKRIMSDLMEQAKGGKVITPKKALRYVFDQIGFANRCIEDICRFTAFTTSRQMGRSVEESIADAKNVSVNFNKKGSGQGYGASTLRTAYLFYNAGVQGLDNFVSLYKKNSNKFTIGTASMLAAGALMPFFNQLIAMALGGDPDEYLDMPEWIRRNNMVLGGNGFYITVPLPIELRAIYGIGDIAYMASAGRMKNKNIAGEILGQLTDVLPVDPVGNNTGVANLVPDIVSPLFENLINEDFTGKPIFKDNSFNRYYPAFTKAYAGTNKALVRASELINRIGGGDDVTKGWVENNVTIADVNNPAKWEHIFEGYFGGALITANEAAKTLSMIWDPDQRILRNVPLANVLLQHNDERTSNSFINDMYYYYKEEYDKVKQSVTKYGQDPEKYSKQQRSLEDKDRYKRYLVFEEHLDEIKNVEKELKEAPDDETKRDLNAYYNRLKGRLVDELMKRD